MTGGVPPDTRGSRSRDGNTRVGPRAATVGRGTVGTPKHERCLSTRAEATLHAFETPATRPWWTLFFWKREPATLVDVWRLNTGRDGADEGRVTVTGVRATIGNDPSAGSPTETLLRLLLPLNDQV